MHTKLRKQVKQVWVSYFEYALWFRIYLHLNYILLNFKDKSFALKFFFAVTILSFMLSVQASVGQEESTAFDQKIKFSQYADEDLSLSEWKRLKNFERKLKLSDSSRSEKEMTFRAYTRDSIQILSIKLMAVKLLEEKNLLERDIAENNEYYTALVQKLKQSEIPPAEYLFLEEKMAFLNQVALERKLNQSRWLILGLIIICVVLANMAFQFRKRAPQHPELSKQEITVQNLILEGKTNKEIANELFISLSTVKTHITNIYGKLKISSRQELFQKSTGTST